MNPLTQVGPEPRTWQLGSRRNLHARQPSHAPPFSAPHTPLPPHRPTSLCTHPTWSPPRQIKNTQKVTKAEIELGLTGKASWHDRYKHSAYVFAGGAPASRERRCCRC